ncbi:MAG: S41 family peptidase [Bacteroidales bacterium]|nr:S41 family peptidase [Bacteroidales bacterium]
MKKLLIIVMAFFVFPFGSLIAQHNVEPMDYEETTRKVSTLLQLINNFYVDTLDMPELTEKAIVLTLKELDPHSAYISAKNVKKANEPLEGSFEGVGLTFQLFKDTILVIAPIPGGPSDKVGIFAGDKIITVNGEDAFGEDITNQWVMDHLRGKKGTEVTVGIYRRGVDALIDFSIVRDKIPINSLDAAFMLDDMTGYVKLNRFARNSQDEFHEAVAKLRAEGMKNLVFDLRGNSGGFLGTAMAICDDFLKSGELIVYTEGIHSPRQDLNATGNGIFEQGKLVVLINEGSASASEIVSGAVQDLDRGLIIGRRSFGKGLVQRPFSLPDGSVVRLTVARYYTPSGRSIQKPYDNGVDEYYKDFANRMKHGELIHPDSIHFPDSLKFATKHGRTVYGGGGIMPDIFVPWDSARYNDLYASLVRKGVFNGFVNEYLDSHRKALLREYKTFQEFNTGFEVSEREFEVFLATAEKKKVEWKAEQLDQNIDFIKLNIKALLARNLYETGSYFEVLSPMDREIKQALKVIKEGTGFTVLK